MSAKTVFVVGLLIAALPIAPYLAHAELLSPRSERKVTVSGTVPDEASRAAVVARLRELYGPQMVVDQLDVGGVTAPPNWTNNAVGVLRQDIRQVHRGQLDIAGTQVAISGEVASTARRQQLVSEMAAALTSTYTVTDRLSVPGDAQTILDQTLANRVVEFESGAAILTPVGITILDEMAAAIAKLEKPRIEIVGHTDSTGNRMANVALSLERADAVKRYMATKGIAEADMTALGAGPDRPFTSNETSEGRARNRRIEFRLLN